MKSNHCEDPEKEVSHTFLQNDASGIRTPTPLPSPSRPPIERQPSPKWAEPALKKVLQRESSIASTVLIGESKANPNERIPDKKMGISQACLVDGCGVYTTDGQDTWAMCQPGCTLKDGKRDNDKSITGTLLVPSVLSCFWFF